MKKFSKILTLFLAFGLAGCGAKEDVKKPVKKPQKPKTVDVFVLSGQSNMEGSTYWEHPSSGKELLKEYLATRDDEPGRFEEIKAGFDNVLTSYYGFYYPNKWGNAHSSAQKNPEFEGKTMTNEDKLSPYFMPTTVGMGVGDVINNKKDMFMGPELGLASKLSEVADEDNPIRLVKCAFSGSGFKKTDGPNWTSRDEDPDKSLFYLLKTYTKACIENIEEETGKEVVLRGFLWHQGESDGGDSTYGTMIKTLVGDFREEFKDYAPDDDKEKIAFIDCTIHDNPNSGKATYGDAANNAKLAYAAESEDDYNFCVDAGWKTENGLKLDIGDDASGGYNRYHYNTKDCYILGEAYAQIILDNNLLDD